MSKDQPDGPPGDQSGNSNEASEEMNLFASVWVKVEVNADEEESNEKEDNEKETKNEGSDYSPSKRKPRGQYKKRKVPNKKVAPEFKNLKCELCDYRTKYKNCLAIHILGHEGAKPLTCTECDYSTRYPVSLKRHLFVKHEILDTIANNKEVETYSCDKCPYQTHFKWNLSSHQRKHDVSKLFQCQECDYSTAYKNNIIKHKRTHTKAEEAIYYCDKCPFATKYQGHITRHLAKVHLEVSELAHRCEFCSFSTKLKWRLNIHSKRSHQNNTFNCAYCDYQTEYRCAFKEHKLTHNEATLNNQQWLDSLFTPDTVPIQAGETSKEEQALEIMKMCEIRSKIDSDASTDLSESKNIYNEIKGRLNADMTYFTYNADPHQKVDDHILDFSQLSEHEKNNHYQYDAKCEVEWGNIQVTDSADKERPFQCVACSYQAKFKASVQRHFQRHHTNYNRPYKCVNCGFSTKTKDQISLHNRRSNSNEVLSCRICGFTTVFRCQFTMHEKAHYPFKCVYCPYTCKKKYDIQKHFTIVHLGKGLKCSYCDFRAMRKESLLCHEAIHTGKKPFQCQLCEYTSVRRTLLENHMNRFHKSKMVEKIIDDSKIESLKKVMPQPTATNTLEKERQNVLVGLLM